MPRRHGYTLVEIAVVLIFIGILGAIGATTLAGSQTTAEDQVAKNRVEAAITAQLNYKQNYGRYATSPEDIQAITVDGTIYTTNPSTNNTTVNITTLTDGIGIAVAVDDERCVVARLDENGNGPDPSTVTTDAGTPCTGSIGS